MTASSVSEAIHPQTMGAYTDFLGWLSASAKHLTHPQTVFVLLFPCSTACTGPGVTLQAMLLFIPRLLSVLQVEMLVHGNASPAEVHNKKLEDTFAKMFGYMRCATRFTPFVFEEFVVSGDANRSRQLSLPAGL